MAMQISLSIHNRIVRELLFLFGGYEVKTTGDGFLLAFQTAQAAMQFGLSLQEALTEVDWPKPIQEQRRRRNPDSRPINGLAPGLSISLGLNFGEPFSAELNPVTDRVDYFGPLINKTARIQGATKDDTMVVTDAYITQLAFEQSGHDLGLETLQDRLRASILEKEICGRNFKVGFAGEIYLKGIEDPEYVSLVSLMKFYGQ